LGTEKAPFRGGKRRGKGAPKGCGKKAKVAANRETRRLPELQSLYVWK